MNNENDILYNDEAEKAVIVSCILDNSVLQEINDLNPDYFRDTRHQVIINAILELCREGKPFDALILSEKIKQHGKSNIVDYGYLTRFLEGELPDSLNIKHHFDIVKDYAGKRNLEKISKSIMQDINDGKNVLDIIAEKKKTLEGLENETLLDVSDTHYSLNHFDDDLTRQLAKLQSELIPDVYYYGGAISIIGGRTGHGKTTFLINECIRLLKKKIETPDIKPDYKLAFISLEENKTFIAKKLLTCFYNLNPPKNDKLKTNIPHARYFDSDITQVKEALLNNLFIFDNPDRLEALETLILQYHKKHGINIFFIDYIQRIYFNDKTMNRLTRQEQIKHVNARLLNIAKKYELYLIMGGQFNRTVTSYEQVKRDIIFREAGDIEQDANLLVNLWNEKSDVNGKMKFYIAKNRNGKVGGEYESDIDLEHLLIDPAKKAEKKEKAIEKKTKKDENDSTGLGENFNWDKFKNHGN